MAENLQGFKKHIIDDSYYYNMATKTAKTLFKFNKN